MSNKPLVSFDFAIKYLLRNKEDYDIVEGFISALFVAEGYKPVKINALLESESNKEDKDLKRSVADLIVEDDEGNKYIVEIERSFTSNFMHKACFNTSRLVIDSIATSQDYTSIKKVFHISLLYFSTNKLDKTVYHGKTVLHDIDTQHPIDIRIANQGLVMFDNYNIFPEYFFIFVPTFDDKINEELDEWLYVLKNSDTRDDFKSPYMNKVKERLSVLKMSTEERIEYFKYLKEAVHSQDVLMAAEAKGEARGMEKGVQKGIAEGMEKGSEKRNIEIVQNLLKANSDIKFISSVTGLSKEEILKLKMKL